jgi:hypothetical protein
VAEDPSPEDESLESFYGEDADEVPGANGDGEIRAKPHAGEGRKRTLTGALMTGIALGFRQVFEPEYHDRTAVEQPAPEQPTEPQKYEIHLDPVAPESSFAIYRPWIDGEPQPEPDAEADLEPGPAAPVEKPKGGGMGALGG